MLSKGKPQMKRNSRLLLALHSLSHMAESPERVRTSAEIADHAGTNPVVVRRVLGELRKSGLLKSEKGHAGGWSLGRDPETITLADVYLALDEKLIFRGEKKINSSCPLENSLYEKISNILEKVEGILIEELRNRSISDI